MLSYICVPCVGLPDPRSNARASIRVTSRMEAPRPRSWKHMRLLDNCAFPYTDIESLGEEALRETRLEEYL